MKNILIIMLLTLGVQAKTVVGKILYAYDEEGVTPVIGIKVNGKEKYYNGTINYSGASPRSFLVKTKKF